MPASEGGVRGGVDGGRDVAPWARALVAQRVVQFAVATARPAFLLPPPHPFFLKSLQLGGLFGAGLNLSSLCVSPAGGESGSSPRRTLRAFS